MGELVIRRYREADRRAVWDLHNAALDAVGAHAGNGPWDDDLHDIRGEYLASGGEFLVGELDGRVVAMGALWPSGRGRAEITRMRVHPDFWRRGFGRQILARLEQRARERGYRRLHLQTTTVQTAARLFYEGCGYAEVRRFREGRFDVIEYEKRLSSREA